MPRLAACALVAVLTALGCGSVPPADYPTVAPSDDVAPHLGSEDVLEVTIFTGTKESKSTHTLDAAGVISVAYIGEVQAAGRSVHELRDEIRARLADGYLVAPIVSITVTEVNSRKISVTGQVNRAQTLRFTPGMTIVDAIAQAADFTPMAKKNGVQVVRVVAGVERTYTIPVEAIREGKRPNFPMAAGDRVFVPERLF